MPVPSIGPPSYPPRETRVFGRPTKRAGAGAVVAVASVAALVVGIARVRGPKHGVAPVARVASGEAELHAAKSGAFRRWPADGAVRVVLDDSLDAIGPGAKDAVRNAVGAWLGSGASLPSVTFDTAHGSPYPTSPDGVSTVIFAPITTPGHELDLAITLPAADEETGVIAEADIVINANHPWAVLAAESDPPAGANVASKVTRGACPPANASGAACGGKFDLGNVATHELGHFFGLGEDWDDAAATMFACSAACEVHKRRLTDADRAAVAKVYAEGAGQSVAGCTLGRPPARGSVAVVAVGLAVAASAVGRRRRA